MSRKPATHRVDSNQQAIVAIAEGLGWQVLSLTALGGGAPDLLLWRYPQGFRLVEVKHGPRQRLRASQLRFRERYGMPVIYLHTEAQARDVLTIISRAR